MYSPGCNRRLEGCGPRTSEGAGECVADTVRASEAEAQQVACSASAGCPAGFWASSCPASAPAVCEACGDCPHGLYRHNCSGISPGVCVPCASCGPAGFASRGACGGLDEVRNPSSSKIVPEVLSLGLFPAILNCYPPKNCGRESASRAAPRSDALHCPMARRGSCGGAKALRGASASSATGCCAPTGSDAPDVGARRRESASAVRTRRARVGLRLGQSACALQCAQTAPRSQAMRGLSGTVLASQGTTHPRATRGCATLACRVR